MPKDVFAMIHRSKVRGLLNAKLGVSAWAVYVWIMSGRDFKTGRFDRPQSEIAHDTGLDRTTVWRAEKSLEALGYIKIHKEGRSRWIDTCCTDATNEPSICCSPATNKRCTDATNEPSICCSPATDTLQPRNNHLLDQKNKKEHKDTEPNQRPEVSVRKVPVAPSSRLPVNTNPEPDMHHDLPIILEAFKGVSGRELRTTQIPVQVQVVASAIVRRNGLEAVIGAIKQLPEFKRLGRPGFSKIWSPQGSSRISIVEKIILGDMDSNYWRTPDDKDRAEALADKISAVEKQEREQRMRTNRTGRPNILDVIQASTREEASRLMNGDWSKGCICVADTMAGEGFDAGDKYMELMDKSDHGLSQELVAKTQDTVMKYLKPENKLRVYQLVVSDRQYKPVYELHGRAMFGIIYRTVEAHKHLLETT